MDTFLPCPFSLNVKSLIPVRSLGLDSLWSRLIAMPEQASSGHSFQLGILPERKIDRRALAASYGFVVLLALLLINLGMLFPDRLQLKQYRVTSLIPMPALRPEHVAGQPEAVVKVKLLPPAPVFQQPKLVVPHEVRHITAPEPVEAPKVVINSFSAPPAQDDFRKEHAHNCCIREIFPEVRSRPR